jgi:methylthioribose-1-phosphate isomerase
VLVNGKPYQSIWLDEHDRIFYINQEVLPFEFRIEEMRSSADSHEMIRNMKVRGAPLIGVAAAMGIFLACREARQQPEPALYLKKQAATIRNARPTAINLAWAVDRMMKRLAGMTDPGKMILEARNEAVKIREEELHATYMIGRHGLDILREIHEKNNGNRVNILTHCNAGWLACIDYGTATSPIYQAHDDGIPVHVWVDETRPRNQGARLTAWELGQHGIPHTVIVDNAGGHIMQHGMVDVVITGSDRTTRRGDVANKIGTYLKALAARDNDIPFYVALPISTIDFTTVDGKKEIPIEERDPDEVRFMEGMVEKGIHRFRIMPGSSPVSNFGFDVTPARLVTGLITEKGICRARENEIMKLMEPLT